MEFVGLRFQGKGAEVDDLAVIYQRTACNGIARKAMVFSHADRRGEAHFS